MCLNTGSSTHGVILKGGRVLGGSVSLEKVNSGYKLCSLSLSPNLTSYSVSYFLNKRCNMISWPSAPATKPSSPVDMFASP